MSETTAAMLLSPQCTWVLENLKGVVKHIPEGVPSRSAPSPFTSYLIAITILVEHAETQQHHLLSERRFRDFVALRSKLCKEEANFMQTLPASFPGKTILRRSSVASKTVKKREHMLFNWLRTIIDAPTRDGDKWKQKPKLAAAADKVRRLVCQWLIDSVVNAEKGARAKALFRGGSGQADGEQDEKALDQSSNNSSSTGSKEIDQLDMLLKSREQRLELARKDAETQAQEMKAQLDLIRHLGRKEMEEGIDILAQGINVFKFSNRRHSLVGSLKQKRLVWLTNSDDVTWKVKWCKGSKEKHAAREGGGHDNVLGGSGAIAWTNKEQKRFSIAGESRTLHLEAIEVDEVVNYMDVFENVFVRKPLMDSLLESIQKVGNTRIKLQTEWASAVVSLTNGSSESCFDGAMERMRQAISRVLETEQQCNHAWQKLLQDTSLKESEIQRRISAPAGSFLEKILAPIAASVLSGGAGGKRVSLYDSLDVLPGDKIAEELKDALHQKTLDIN